MLAAPERCHRHRRRRRRSLPGVCRRGWLLPYRARPRRATRASPDATKLGISSAYRKPHTCWQHYAAYIGGMTYGEPARTTSRRIPGILVAGLLVAIAAIAAAFGYQLLAPASSTATSPIDFP